MITQPESPVYKDEKESLVDYLLRLKYGRVYILKAIRGDDSYKMILGILVPEDSPAKPYYDGYYSGVWTLREVRDTYPSV